MATPTDRWFEAVALVDARDADLVADALAMSGAEGIAVEPAIFIRDDADFAYDELTDRPWTVRATFASPFGDADEARVRAAIASLSLSAPLHALSIGEAEQVDWAEEWKQFYRIQHIGRLVIRPSWEEYEPAEGEVVVALDPGAAFGTGEHETTRLCLAAIERYLQPGDCVLDVGSGSGILAVAASMLGAGEVHALDIDADTVRVARENAARNDASDAIDFAAGSVGPDWPWPDRPAAGYDLVLANISSLVIGRITGDLAQAARAGGLVVASGFILRDADEVRGFLPSAGLTEVDYLAEGNWGCLVAER
ncbi:MAG: 50S ribosomal protein L11 methyltransferase [Chloroflexi bacterium]|nr:50S ribosomal protein L11 methyltransferase [Chloroflexota bacterium]MQC48271.1 50S ribosomal protein L11 methyltransferase [Chloroflexota bacterium]